MKPHEEHRRKGTKSLAVAVVTVSTSRYGKKREGVPYTDEGGDVIAAACVKAGHTVARRTLISDERPMIRKETKVFLSGHEDVLLFTGGTGLSPRDVTVETVRPFFEKELEGFGELVRRLGFDEIGSAAALTRATAGVARGKLIICLPGSPNAVRSSMNAFVGEFPHILFIARG